MNFFRRWHAHQEFRHHFGHGHQCHSFSGSADGFAYHLGARVGRKLDLDDRQQRLLGDWLHRLQQQRDALKSVAGGAKLSALMADEQFARESAQQLLDAHLDALRAAGPGLVGVFADFFDSLDDEQRQALRFMMRRAGRRQRDDA